MVIFHLWSVFPIILSPLLTFLRLPSLQNTTSKKKFAQFPALAHHEATWYFYAPFHIFIKILLGQSLIIWEKGSDLVEDIKYLLELSQGIAKDHQWLVYEGKQLTKSFPLDTFNISNDSTIIMSLRLKGGNPR